MRGNARVRIDKARGSFVHVQRPVSVQRNVLILSLAGLAAIAFAGFRAQGGLAGEGVRFALGALTGGLAGFALYHAAFGFTAAWRRMVRERRGAGLRAQMALLALTCVVTYPLIGYQALTGWDMHPVVMPMGIVSALGAFAFGIGMQLGGGCASGTLFAAGGGSVRMLVVLAAFILGSVSATAHLPTLWASLPEIAGVPDMPGTSLLGALGVPGALAALLVFCGGVALASRAVERRAHGAIEAPRPTGSVLHGPWSPLAGAAALAAVGVLCFLIFARPWSVTAGFALWGAKLFQAIGVPVAEWPYWQGWRAGQLAGGVFADRTSLMNFGIVFGAMAAAALAGRFRAGPAISWRELAVAAAGGLLMGYGARLAYGCNIGAYLGGVVSGSLHGWWWLVWGFAGSMAGTRLRAALEPGGPLSPSHPVVR